VESEASWKKISAHVREITDVSGAGDTVIAVATLCLIANLEPEQIAAIANLAGGMVCEHSGVVSVDSNALLLEANKLS
jgi:bifunctional ADP-heptose synthase (sugar kinase/adenylyltransferase)